MDKINKKNTNILQVFSPLRYVHKLQHICFLSFKFSIF